MAKKAQATLGANDLDVIADRGYLSGKEILACEAGITVTLPKPMTSTKVQRCCRTDSVAAGLSATTR